MNSIPRTFYVYILARPDGAPFYVGKGTGDRIYEHDKEARKGHRCHKCNMIRKIWKSGNQVQRYIVFETQDESEAFAHERQLIALYGRETLTNLTDGGEGIAGFVFSEETRRKMSESRKGRSAKNKGQPVSEEVRRRISETLRGRKSPSHVAEMLRKSNMKPQSEERRRNIALGQTGGKLYTIVAPDGTVYEHVANITGFEKEHGLKQGLSQVVRGQVRQYYGWRGWEEGTEPQPLIPKPRYTIIAPDGMRYTGITNVSAFAREHGLDGHQLRTVLRGNRPRYKKWTGFREVDT